MSAPPSSQADRSRLLSVGGMFCALAYGYLAWVSQSYGEATLMDFYIAVLPCLVITFALWGLEARGYIDFSWLHILAFAILFRCIGALGYPILEDDHFRYLWDGWMFIEHGVVYGVAPAEFFDQTDVVPDHLVEVLDGINYPNVATVYGPVAQFAFSLSYLIAPGEIWPLQIICALADIAIIVLLARLVPLRWVFLYAWSPLLIKEFSFTAHIDVVGAACMMIALYLSKPEWANLNGVRPLFWKRGLTPFRLDVLVGVALACAAGVKPFVLIVAPFLLGLNLTRWGSLGMTCLVLALPFGVIDAWLPDGLQAMAENWYFNSPAYYLWFALLPTEAAFASVTTFKLILTLGFVAVWCVCAVRWLVNEYRGQTQDMPVYWLFGLLFLVLPVFNPWYLVWALVFAALRPTATAWVASVAVLFSYVIGLNIGDNSIEAYAQPSWALAIEFGLIGPAFVYDMRHQIRRAGQRALGVLQL